MAPGNNHVSAISTEIFKYSQLPRKQTPSGIEKKCPLVELSAYKNYFHKRTPEKNRVDDRLQGS